MPLSAEEVTRIVAAARARGLTPTHAAELLRLTEEQILAIEATHPTAWQRWLVNDARSRLHVEVGDAITALAHAEQRPSPQRARSTRAERRAGTDDGARLKQTGDADE